MITHQKHAYVRKRIEGYQAGPKVDVRGVHCRKYGDDVGLIVRTDRDEFVIIIYPELAMKLGASLVAKGLANVGNDHSD